MTSTHRHPIVSSLSLSVALAGLALAGCGGGAPAATATPGPASPADEASGPAVAPPVSADAQPAALEQPAPDFTLPDHTGAQVTLSSLRGKTVVLEWFNPTCPFIKYAHADGPLADAAALPGAGDDAVVWLAVNSNAAGKAGSGAETNAAAHDKWNMAYPILIDESGAVGRLFGAKSTPHMFVIDADGKLVYRGALDNAPLGKFEGAEPHNYIADALADLAAGQPLRTKETPSYGCGIKY